MSIIALFEIRILNLRIAVLAGLLCIAVVVLLLTATLAALLSNRPK